ncbi:MAG: outer membrane protein assembly factor BamA [Deltaproteobacteria bacterium]|nr:outer membrane protein assembly factor BamA [Deltaproteobacteria bacterium]
MTLMNRKKISPHSAWIFLFLLLAVFSSRSASAQERVVDIVVVGNRTVESQVILTQIQQTKGTEYSRDKVSADVGRVYKLGLFEDVQADKEPAPGGVKIIFKVVEKGPIDKIVIEGNKKISENKIRETITVKVNQPADNRKLAESKEKLKEIYNKDGYGATTIETEVREKGGQRELVFKITESKAEVVREINFEGNTVFSDAKLRKIIRTKKKGILSFLTGSGKYKEEVIDQDIQLITYNYLNKGYMKVRVGQPKVEASAKANGLILTYFIDEGDAYKIGDISFDGDILTTKEELVKQLHTFKGNYYSQKIMEEDLQKLTEFYGNQGYAFANINPQTNIHDDTKTADINFVTDEGKKVFVERINITGNTITRDKVIRRELRVVENSLYNESLVRLSKRKLEQLGYFETVDISTPRGSTDDKLVLNINVKEKPTGTFSVGAGFSSSESFLLTASVSKNNFMGLGISGSLNGEISGKRQQFSFQFTDPYLFDTDWILQANGFKITSDFEDFRRKSFGGEIDFGRRVFDFSSFSIGYKIEDVKLDDFNLIVPLFFKQNADGLTSSLVFQFQRDTRNNPITTTKGLYSNLSIEYAGNGIGGDVDFLRVTANQRVYVPLWKNSTLKFNGRIGYIKSLNDQPVPLFERFFTGGINSLRGYEFRSVGPRVTIPDGITGSDQEFVYGGNKLLLFNLEYEFPLYDAAGFRGVVFVDAGNAFAEDESLNPLKLRADAGAGIRWLSPFGPLRFEWGFPFARREGEKRSVFNFTIGSFF